MSSVTIIVICVAAVVAIGWLLGLGAAAAWLWTAVYHAFIKPEPLPGEKDSKWSRDQGREVK